MENARQIFVTGGTGNQGGAVARHLVQLGFSIKVLTRDPDSEKAKKLQGPKTALVKGNLDQPDSFRDHLKGVYGIFSVQAMGKRMQNEMRQGIELANLAREFRIDHLIYSSGAGAVSRTGIPHWDSKLNIENHIKQINIPYTIIRPSSLFENFLIPQVKNRITQGKLVSPAREEAIQQFMAADDIGVFCSRIFMNTQKYLGKTITLGTEEMTMKEVAACFSEVLGFPVKYQKLPGLITRLVMGKDLHLMFQWINENNAIFIKDLEGFKREHPDLLSLKSWIKIHFKKD
jgi:uncharacterized protein YbjT (DUF2867 family)